MLPLHENLHPLGSVCKAIQLCYLIPEDRAGSEWDAALPRLTLASSSTSPQIPFSSLLCSPSVSLLISQTLFSSTFSLTENISPHLLLAAS